jgi:hypothetical protein
MSFTKLDYCQYLLSSQVNYTITNMAEHLKSFSHDSINRYLKGEKLTPRLLFEQVEPLLEPNGKAYLLFDDTVLDKSFGPMIEVTRKQWSGNDKSVIRGIGVVSCVYVNPETERFWVIDYRTSSTPEGRLELSRPRKRDVALGRASRGALRDGARGRLVRHEGADGPDREDGQEVLLSAKEQPPGRRLGRRASLQAGRRARVERAEARAGQAHKDQGLPQRAQGEAVPGSGASSPHGMDRNQRSFSGLGA